MLAPIPERAARANPVRSPPRAVPVAPCPGGAHSDNVVTGDGWPDCGHDPLEEMLAYDALPGPVRRAVSEARFEWCAVGVMAMRLRWYSAAKRRLATQELAYLRESALLQT